MILEPVSYQIGQHLFELREGDDEVLALHQIVKNGQICFLVDVIEEVRLHHVVGVVPNQLLALSLRLFDYLLNVKATIIRQLCHNTNVLCLVIRLVWVLFSTLDFVFIIKQTLLSDIG
jgi:hypothetical protein